MDGSIASMGDMKNAYTVSVPKPEGRRHSEDVGIDGRTDNIRMDI
jgi:hypothetical protein